MAEVGDGVGKIVVDLRGVEVGDAELEVSGMGVGAVDEDGVERLVEAGVDVFTEAGEIDTNAFTGGVGELFVEGGGEGGGEGESSVAGYAVVDVMT